MSVVNSKSPAPMSVEEVLSLDNEGLLLHFGYRYYNWTTYGKDGEVYDLIRKEVLRRMSSSDSHLLDTGNTFPADLQCEHEGLCDCSTPVPSTGDGDAEYLRTMARAHLSSDATTREHIARLRAIADRLSDPAPTTGSEENYPQNWCPEEVLQWGEKFEALAQPVPSIGDVCVKCGVRPANRYYNDRVHICEPCYQAISVPDTEKVKTEPIVRNAATLDDLLNAFAWDFTNTFPFNSVEYEDQSRKAAERRTTIHQHVEGLVLEAFTDGLIYQGLFPMEGFTPKQIREMAPRALEFVRTRKPSTGISNE